MVTKIYFFFKNLERLRAKRRFSKKRPILMGTFRKWTF
jgi:hypothetical protein